MATNAAFHDKLDPTLRERAVEVARAMRREHRLSDRLERFRPLLQTERRRDVPTLHLDDISGIPGVEDVSGVEEYQHRARIRASDGDGVIAATEPALGYEDYNRDILNLGAPETFVVGGDGDPLACAEVCCEGETLDRIAAWADQFERLVVEPFMAIEPVWRLASRLDEHDVDVTVCGPPLPSLWLANDKRHLAEIADQLFEEPPTVKTHVESDPGQMAERLLELAEDDPQVALKRTRSASAMGNKVYESRDLLEAGHREVLRDVRAFLDDTDWPEGREVLLVRWVDSTVSPSTQCWVPPDGTGRPYVDGIYEQLLIGGQGIFAGSRPSTLPEPLHRDLLEISLALLTVYQKLGYVGRCSFDFVVTGDPQGDYSAYVVDGNGRWGGTSLPMQLVDRLVPDHRPAYRAQDYVDSELEGASFDEIVEACREELFCAETGEGRFVFYNPGPLREHGKFDVISLGRTQDEAAEGIEEVLPRLLGV